MTARPLSATLLAALALALATGGAACDPVGTLTVDHSISNPQAAVITPPVELAQEQRLDAASQGGPIAVRGDQIVVAAPLTDEVVFLRRSTLEVTGRVDVADTPHHVVLTSDGTVWVTERYNGTVARIPAGSDEVDLRVDVGLEPWGLALDASRGALWVSLGGDRQVARIDTTSGAVAARVEVDGRPRGLALSAAGSKLGVAIFEGFAVSLDVGDTVVDARPSVPLRASLPWEIFSTSFFNTPFSLPQAVLSGPRGARAITAADGFDFSVAHSQINQAPLSTILEAVGTSGGPGEVSCEYCEWGAPTTSVSLRPVETAVSRVDANGVPVGVSTSPAQPTEGVAEAGPLFQRVSDPVDIRRHPTLAVVFVVGQGSDNIGLIDVANRAGWVSDPMHFWLGIASAGQRPTGVAFSDEGAFAYVLNAHDLTVSEIDLAPMFDIVGSTETQLSLQLSPSRSASFGMDPRPEAVRRGERLFFFAGDPTVSRNALFACGSCHIDGLDDGITWGFTKGTRQTPILAGRLHDTAPFNWEGSKDGLIENMVLTVQRMGGEGLDAQGLADLEAFLLDGLRAPPQRDEPLDAVELLGEQIFHDPAVGCANCHSGTGTTDGALWDLGTANDDDNELADANAAVGTALPATGLFNTPSLRGLRDSAPYLHDGTAPTLHAVFYQVPGMGNTSHLTESELDALVAYLLTL